MEDAQCHVAKQNEISCHSCCSLPCWCLAWENGAKSSKAEWLIRWFSSSWMWRTPFLYDLNSCAYLFLSTFFGLLIIWSVMNAATFIITVTGHHREQIFFSLERFYISYAQKYLHIISV